ncbi:MAG: hypothetical protein AAF604_12155 [Acidobacteriota bacterium]
MTRRNQRLEKAVELLAQELRVRIEGHPWGHLMRSGDETLDLPLSLSTALRNGGVRSTADNLATQLDRAIEGLLAHRAAFRPGRIFCLRCRTPDCDHAAPTSSREVFRGYGSTGLPQFIDFGQLLLERGDKRVDRLYERPPALLAHTLRSGDLTRDLLPAYRDRTTGFRLHGQVASGWYSVPDPSGRPSAVALSFQLVSTRHRRGRRRFGLNVLGLGPDGQPLENLYDRLGDLPWLEPVRWAQTALDQITYRGKGDTVPLGKRLTNLLNGLARRLEKARRAKDRKTRHGQQRHRQGDRPTHMALADLARAGEEELLFDTRQKTLVVLGARGRAHVFNGDGKLVTSIRYTPGAIERRRERRIWRPATGEEIAGLRRRIEERSQRD